MFQAFFTVKGRKVWLQFTSYIRLLVKEAGFKANGSNNQCRFRKTAGTYIIGKLAFTLSFFYFLVNSCDVIGVDLVVQPNIFVTVS